MLRRIGSTYDYSLKEYIVNCAQVNQLPTLTLHFNQGTSAQILPRDYTVNVSLNIWNKNPKKNLFLGRQSKMHHSRGRSKSTNTKNWLAYWWCAVPFTLFTIESWCTNSRDFKKFALGLIVFVVEMYIFCSIIKAFFCETFHWISALQRIEIWEIKFVQNGQRIRNKSHFIYDFSKILD